MPTKTGTAKGVLPPPGAGALAAPAKPDQRGFVDAEPTRSRLDATEQASRLLAWLQANPWPNGERALFADQMLNAYQDMCGRLELQPRPWQVVAKELALMLHDGVRPLKIYRDRLETDGRVHRRRIYILPTTTAPNDTS